MHCSQNNFNYQQVRSSESILIVLKDFFTKPKRINICLFVPLNCDELLLLSESYHNNVPLCSILDFWFIFTVSPKSYQMSRVFFYI